MRLFWSGVSPPARPKLHHATRPGRIPVWLWSTLKLVLAVNNCKETSPKSKGKFVRRGRREKCLQRSRREKKRERAKSKRGSCLKFRVEFRVVAAERDLIALAPAAGQRVREWKIAERLRTYFYFHSTKFPRRAHTHSSAMQFLHLIVSIYLCNSYVAHISTLFII